ncbi:MAG: Bug family tripartite tricarboxylate transporter substrate binding protein [Hyphomicrobiaceae bacterium]
MALTVCTLVSAHAAQAVENFYKGKTITVYVGFGPGGAYDYYARVFSRYMGKYVPGHPTIVVQNMPGAASLRAANFVYNVAPKDGTVMGVAAQTLMVEEAMGGPAVRYKSTELNWIGRMTSVLEVMIVREGAKVKSVKDLAKYELIAGGTGPASPTEGYPRLLNSFGGAKFRIVSGYKGVAAIMLAIDRGEVDAVENSMSHILRVRSEDLKSGRIWVLAQASLERSSLLPKVPTLIEFGKDEKAKAAIEFYTRSAAVSRSMFATPGVPADRVKALRDAFNATAKDPELLADVKKANVEFNPAPGVFLQDLAAKVMATPKEIVEAAKKAVAPN